MKKIVKSLEMKILFSFFCIIINIEFHLQHTLHGYTERNFPETDVSSSLSFSRRRGNFIGFQTRLESIRERIVQSDYGKTRVLQLRDCEKCRHCPVHPRFKGSF